MAEETRSTKPKGWFSRRHHTNETHLRSRETYLAKHGPKARRARAAEIKGDA